MDEILDEGEEIPMEEIPAKEALQTQKIIPTEKEINDALQSLLQDIRNEDKFVRDDMVRLCRRLDYYWNNIIDIFLDPATRDWRTPNWDELAASGEYSPRLINIYRPHGEAIVAALSITVPATTFIPDDAQNPHDLDTARAYSDIRRLLAAHDDARMLFIRAIVVLFNQGTIFGYNYYHEDPNKFGTFQVPNIEYKQVDTFTSTCPVCGSPVDSGLSGYQEEEPSMGLGGAGGQKISQCPECGYTGEMQTTEGVEELPQIVGFSELPKGSVTRKIFDCRQVKVPAYVKSQDECGYLLLEFFQSTAMLRSIFKEKKISSNKSAETESFSRLPAQYVGYTPDNCAYVSCLWLRPWQFYQLEKEEIRDHFLTTYPDGLYVILVNNEVMEIYPEKMDEHWTISEDPLGGFIYARPMGENLATIQDIRAQLVEIELQTAEYGIPETFIDGKVLDFEKYGEGRAQPGAVTKAKARSGQRLSDGFHQTSPATLSREIGPLKMQMDQDAQFVSSSFPSIYGGPSISGSKTASEYSQSRDAALQRLGTTWKILCHFWSRLESRSVVEYANRLKEQSRDERFVEKSGDSFVNTWIRHTSLTGKIGRVEPEASEQLPVSWAQKKDTLMGLIPQLPPELLSVLMHPNNATFLKTSLGLAEIYVPGEEDRIRQSKEFLIMSQGIPTSINLEFDNHAIHIETLRSILEGPQGEVIDPQVMQICLQHLNEHLMAEAMNAQQQEQQNGESGNGDSGASSGGGTGESGDEQRGRERASQ